MVARPRLSDARHGWVGWSGCVAMVWSAVLFMMPVTAVAGTVSESSEGVLVFQARPGERNAVSVRSLSLDGAWEIRDTGAAIEAGAGCLALDFHTVSCPERPDRHYASVELQLADLDDRFESTSPVFEDFGLSGRVLVDGGPGPDELVAGTESNELLGGDGNDVLTAAGQGSEINRLNGGPGDDRLVGGPLGDDLDGGGGRDQILGGGGDDRMTDGDSDGAAGDAAPGPDLLDGGDDDAAQYPPGDMVSYSTRSAAVMVDLVDSGVDGEAGEGDVVVGVESVEGGRGADRLRGSRRANMLIGGPGRDRLEGRGGRDALVPGELLRTTISPLASADIVSCGSGRFDSVSSPDPTIFVPRDCEFVSWPGGDYYRPYPRQTAGGALRHTLRACPYVETDGERVPRCRGRVFVVKASGRQRVLATAAIPFQPRKHGTDLVLPRVRIPLTRFGRRVAASGREVRAIVHVQYRPRDYAPRTHFAWMIELTLPRAR